MNEFFEDFRAIVLQRPPLIDVRAPVEFHKGAFPNAVNLPLMNDVERELVGIRYKEFGNAEALKLGHELVSGKKREKRIEAWCDFKKRNPDALLYCFRGGQRSEIAQKWMAEAGCDILRLRGGYKAFRHYLLEEIERIGSLLNPFVLGGRTGSGKTRLLNSIQRSVDLEALANHRGSAFGRRTTPQPTQISFENALAYELVNLTREENYTAIFEDEGRNVGRLYLPQTIFEHMENAPLVVLDTPMDERVEITFEEYVVSSQQDYEKLSIEDPLRRWYEEIAESMERIKRRLGGERYKIAFELLDKAYQEQIRGLGNEGHKRWIEYLLREYYDPMYDYQISKSAQRVVFRGTAKEVADFLKEALKK